MFRVVLFNNNFNDLPSHQVTPPEEPLPMLGVPSILTPSSSSAYGGGGGGGSSQHGGSGGSSSLDSPNNPNSIMPAPLPGPEERGSASSSASVAPSPQHLHGTIVWYNLMWGRRLRSAVGKNKWIWSVDLQSQSHIRIASVQYAHRHIIIIMWAHKNGRRIIPTKIMCSSLHGQWTWNRSESD